MNKSLIPSLPESGFMRLRQILEILPVGRTKFYELVATGHLPKPCKIGRASLWRVDDVKSLLAKIEAGKLEG